MKDSVPSKSRKTKAKNDAALERNGSQRHLQDEEAEEQPHTLHDLNTDKLDRYDSATSLSSSAIIEMFHQLDEVNTLPTSGMSTTRYLVENETTGDFHQVRTRQRNQIFNTARVAKTHQTRQIVTESRISMCWSVLQRNGEKAFVLMLLGIVTGMCWADAMNLRSENVFMTSKTFDSAVCMYSAGFNRWRQTLFLLLKYPSY